MKNTHSRDNKSEGMRKPLTFFVRGFLFNRFGLRLVSLVGIVYLCFCVFHLVCKLLLVCVMLGMFQELFPMMLLPLCFPFTGLR